MCPVSVKVDKCCAELHGDKCFCMKTNISPQSVIDNKKVLYCAS